MNTIIIIYAFFKLAWQLTYTKKVLDNSDNTAFLLSGAKLFHCFVTLFIPIERKLNTQQGLLIK
jgi:hypothetical protein